MLMIILLTSLLIMLIIIYLIIFLIMIMIDYSYNYALIILIIVLMIIHIIIMSIRVLWCLCLRVDLQMVIYLGDLKFFKLLLPIHGYLKGYGHCGAHSVRQFIEKLAATKPYSRYINTSL